MISYRIRFNRLYMSLLYGNIVTYIMISNETSFHRMKENIRHSYVNLDLTKDGFHSERNQTSNSMDIGTYGLNLREPGIEYHIKYPVQGLLAHFRTILNSKGFKVTEVFPGKLLVVKLNLIDRLKYIFTKKRPNSYFLTLVTYQYRSVRKLLIQKIHTTQPEEHEEDQQVENIEKWIQTAPLDIPISPLNNSDENSDNMEMDQYQQDMFSLQATAAYMYHKIFVDNNYSIGKKMQKLLDKGKDDHESEARYQQIHELPLSESKIVVGALNQITDDMLQNFNCTRKELLQILSHCRKAVEDFYHNKKALYKSKSEILFQQSQIDNNLQENQELQKSVPLTIKIFKGLIEEKNSFAIMRGFFFAQFVFNYECELNKQNEDMLEKRKLAADLGKIFSEVISEKTKILQAWGYSNQHWDEYISIFLLS